VFASRLQPGCQRQGRSIELRQNVFAEARDQGILAPLRPRSQGCERGAGFGRLAHALERFVVVVLDQRVEAVSLRLVVQQVATEDREQARLGQERREREEHEVAFRALAAPAVNRFWPKDPEVAIAT
jgi:hypothetical protein